MENIKHCAVLVRKPEDVWEGARTALGLAVENFYAYLFVMDATVNMTEELRENLDWLEDMECEVYSNVKENEPHNMQYMTVEEVGRKLKEMDLVIPFCNRN